MDKIRRNSDTMGKGQGTKFRNDRKEHQSMTVQIDIEKECSCGVRGIWISGSSRRKGIGTLLLNTAR